MGGKRPTPGPSFYLPEEQWRQSVFTSLAMEVCACSAALLVTVTAVSKILKIPAAGAEATVMLCRFQMKPFREVKNSRDGAQVLATKEPSS